jgi:hypothetical protein
VAEDSRRSDQRSRARNRSTLQWQATRCPDTRPGDTWAPAFVGGTLGWGLALLSGVSGPSRVLAAALGAAGGAIASQFHVRVDWDPDRWRDAPSSPPASTDTLSAGTDTAGTDTADTEPEAL